jgi:hypothetical protein
MRLTRRRILKLGGGGLVSRLFGAKFEVDRLLQADSPGTRLELQTYTASATVTLFSIPLVTRDAVGSGYAVVDGSGQTLSIQFGAGSHPESARGLNRLGFIQEAVVEERPGVPSEFAWLAFMTTSQEKSLEQAKGALENSGATVPYSASQGYGRQGRFRCRLDRLEFPSRYTWRDITELVGKARVSMTALQGDERGATHEAEPPATFLYLVRRAILDPRPRTAGSLIFNSKEFRLETVKEADASATAHFAEKKLIASTASVTRLSAMLTEKPTGVRTPFRLWHETSSAQSLPLRFEYQARSFLRLSFEADANASAPQIPSAFRPAQENH